MQQPLLLLCEGEKVGLNLNLFDEVFSLFFSVYIGGT